MLMFDPVAADTQIASPSTVLEPSTYTSRRSERPSFMRTRPRPITFVQARLLLLALAAGLALSHESGIAQTIGPSTSQSPPQRVEFDPDRTDTLLTRVAAVRSLSPEQADRGLPAELTATVTHVDTVWHLLFVQDETGGVFVQPYRPNETPPLAVRPGDRVRIRARTTGSDFAPHLVRPTIERLGQGTLPEASTYDVSELFTGRMDSQFLETEGTVVEAYLDRSHLMMILADGMAEISVRVPYVFSVPDDLIGSRVRIRGVAGTLLNEQDQLRGIYVAVSSLEELSVLDPGVEASSDLPVRSIRQILAFDADRGLHEQVRVEGRITYAGSDSRLFIQDATGGVEVRGRNLGRFDVGTRVEVLAFPQPSERAPILRHAQVRSIAESIPLAPRPITPAEVDSGRFSGYLVSLEGRLENRSSPARSGDLLVRTGDRLLHAHLSGSGFDDAYAGPPEGSRIRMTGVLSVPQPTLFEDEERGTFQLYLRSSADVRVLEEPSWWTAERALVLAGGLGTLLVLGIGWIYALRRRVREKTATIREKMEVESELRAKAQRAAEAREEMMTHLHHEIRSPLSSVIGFADLLMDRVRESHRRHLRHIQTSARRIMNLAERMLNFARLEAGELELKPSSIDVAEVVAEAAHTLMPQARENDVDFTVEMPDDELEGRMDPTFLAQIVQNITGNAIKYTTDGCVEVTVDSGPEDGQVRIAVTDTGPGMTIREIESVFEPFEQGTGGKKSGEGVGLGLHITARMVDLMGGTIDLESTPGEGTRFDIVLPCYPETHPEPQKA